MANHNEPVTYHVYLYDSTTPTGVDVSAYIQPDYASVKILAESRLYQFEAGDLTLNFVDKDTPQTHRAWSNRIAQSTSYSYGGKTLDWPMVRVYDPSDTTHPLYVGFIDKRNTVWDGDVISSFRALSMMAYLDTIDAEPARNGEAATGQYSGYADTLAISLLAKAGCASPATTANVDIKDMKLGDTQSALDWNHVSRSWSAGVTDDPVTGWQLSDIVPANLAAVPNLRGYTVYKGRVQQVTLGTRSAVTLTDLTASLQALFPRKADDLEGHAYRLLPVQFSKVDGGPAYNCLAIINARAMSTYSKVKTNWSGYTAVDPAVRLGSMGLALIPGWGAAAALGVNVAMSVAEGATENTSLVANNDAVWYTTSILIVSIEADGTLGATIAKDTGVGTLTTTAGIYSPDSIATSNDHGATTSPGEIWYIHKGANYWDTPVFRIYRRTYAHGTDNASQNSVVRELDLATYGEPAGGIAVIAHTLMVGTTKGAVMLTQKDTVPVQWKVEVVNRDRPPARTIAAFKATRADDAWALFVYGNGTADYLSQLYIRDGQRIASPPDVDVDYIHDYPSGASVHGEAKVYNCSPFAQNMTVDGHTTAHAGAVVSIADSNGRENVYATSVAVGPLHPQVVLVLPSNDDPQCANPLPGGSGADWQPPHIFTDTGEVSGVTQRRMIVFGKRREQYHNLWDIYVSSLIMVARVHWDFKLYPLSIRQAIEGITRSFYCWSRVFDPDTPPVDGSRKRLVSRHSYSPADAGDIGRGEVQIRPQVQGIEWYDGVRAIVEGETIESGSTKIGRQVFNLTGLFLSSGWAREIASRIVTNYPSTSTDPSYPNGRRIFVVNLRRISSTTNVKPGYYDLFKTVDLSIFSDAAFTGIKGLILSVGYSRQTATYQLTLIEWDDYDVDWTVNAAAPTCTDFSYAASTLTSAPATMESGGVCTAIGWLAHGDLITTGMANPYPAYPCAWAFKVHVCGGLKLSHYLYGLRRDGVGTDAALWLAIFSDSGGPTGHPLERISETMALALHDGRSVGPYWQPLNYQLADTSGEDSAVETSGTGLRDPYIENYPLPEGDYWVVMVQDGTASGSTPVPMDWIDGGMAGMGLAYQLSFVFDTSSGTSGFASGEGTLFGTWIDNWDQSKAVRTQYAPAIYLIGEA